MKCVTWYSEDKMISYYAAAPLLHYMKSSCEIDIVNRSSSMIKHNKSWSLRNIFDTMKLITC